MVSPSSKRFPLPASPFVPLRLTPVDETAIANIANDLLVTTVVDYEMLHLREGGVMNPARWKAVKHFDKLIGYQARHYGCADPADDHRSPRLVWRGALEGSLSDVMYGMINQSDEMAQTKAAYMRSNVVDSKVLATLVTATPSDPFKGLQIKWMVSASGPGLKRLVRLRDFVYVEATGVTRRASGESVGYHLINSIAIPSIRPLSEYSLVRGNISLLHLFREKTQDTVELYTKVSLDLMGTMPARLALYAAFKTMQTIERLPLCSQQKKLAWMLRASMRARPRSAKLSYDASSCRLCQKNLHGERSLRNRLRHCRICSASACSKCCHSTALRVVDPHTRALVKKKVRVCTACISKAGHASGTQVQLDELARGTWTADFPDTRSTFSLSSSESSQDSFQGAEEAWSDTYVETHSTFSISSSDTSRDSFRGTEI